MKGLKFTLFCIILGISDGYLVYHNALREISPQSKVQEGDVSRGSLYSKEVSFIPKKSTQTCILAVMIIFGGKEEKFQNVAFPQYTPFMQSVDLKV